MRKTQEKIKDTQRLRAAIDTDLRARIAACRALGIDPADAIGDMLKQHDRDAFKAQVKQVHAIEQAEGPSSLTEAERRGMVFNGRDYGDHYDAGGMYQ